MHCTCVYIYTSCYICDAEAHMGFQVRLDLILLFSSKDRSKVGLANNQLHA